MRDRGHAPVGGRQVRLRQVVMIENQPAKFVKVLPHVWVPETWAQAQIEAFVVGFTGFPQEPVGGALDQLQSRALRHEGS